MLGPDYGAWLGLSHACMHACIADGSACPSPLPTRPLFWLVNTHCGVGTSNRDEIKTHQPTPNATPHNSQLRQLLVAEPPLYQQPRRGDERPGPAGPVLPRQVGLFSPLPSPPSIHSSHCKRRHMAAATLLLKPRCLCVAPRTPHQTPHIPTTTQTAGTWASVTQPPTSQQQQEQQQPQQ